jgi:putative transport protein
VETLRSAGLPLVLCGITLTVTPVVVAYAFGRKVLGLNPALLLGGIAGSMTSGAALKVVQDTAKSAIPALGYTSAYTFANVFLTIAGSVLPLFD